MAILNVVLSAATDLAMHKPRNWFRHCVRLTLPLITFLFLSPVYAANPPPVPSVSSAPSMIVRPTTDPKLESWQSVMRTKNNDAPGCYKAHYPDQDWTQVPCIEIPKNNLVSPLVKLQSQHGVVPLITGNGTDYMAQSSVGTKSATGIVTDIDNLISESDSGLGAGKYSLQMNTNGFTPPSSICASCTGWMQFYYDENGGGIFVQYWMLNYVSGGVSACPSGWTTSATVNCFKNGSACNDASNSTVTPAPIVALADLPKVTLTGEAVAGGNDTITLSYGADMVKQSACDNILSLAGNWNDTEFNVLGDFSGDVATFNTGVLITTNITLTDTSADFPACTTIAASSSVTTLESTNMTLASCTPIQSGIRVVEGVPPRIGSINPTTGSTDGGTAVTISAAGDSQGGGFFPPNMMAAFGNNFVGANCTANNCLAYAPRASGVVPVTIENLTSFGYPGPPSTELYNFSYAPFPFGVLSPTQGPVTGGTTVTLSGHNLGLPPGATAVIFGFASGPVTINSATCNAVSSPNQDYNEACIFTTPALPNPPSSGTTVVPVSVTAAGLTSPVGAFTYGTASSGPPVKTTCEQCREQGEMCVIRSGKPVCECQRSSPKGPCI